MDTFPISASSSSRRIKRDLYCWICHMDGALLKCKTCPRTYHRKCATQLASEHFPGPMELIDSTIPGGNVMKGCPECQMAHSTGFTNMKRTPWSDLKKICLSVTRNLRDGYFWPNPFFKLQSVKSDKEYEVYRDLVAKVMDISELERMAQNEQFRTLEALLGEAKWIFHNTLIVHGRYSRDAECAKKIVEVCELEIHAAEQCPECFLREQGRENDPNWFIRPCSFHPHPLGWARISNGLCWPVKIMHWSQDDNKVTVRCFGDYRRFDLPISQCRLYSSIPPKSFLIGNKGGDDLKKAKREIEIHIQNLEKALGRVVIPDSESPLELLGTLDDVRSFMFPNWNLDDEGFHFNGTDKDNNNEKLSTN